MGVIVAVDLLLFFLFFRKIAKIHISVTAQRKDFMFGKDMQDDTRNVLKKTAFENLR